MRKPRSNARQRAEDEAHARLVLSSLFVVLGYREIVFLRATNEANRRRSEANWETFRVLVPFVSADGSASVRDVGRFIAPALGAYRVSRDGWGLSIAGGGFNKAEEVSRRLEETFGLPRECIRYRRL